MHSKPWNRMFSVWATSVVYTNKVVCLSRWITNCQMAVSCFARGKWPRTDLIWARVRCLSAFPSALLTYGHRAGSKQKKLGPTLVACSIEWFRRVKNVSYRRYWWTCLANREYPRHGHPWQQRLHRSHIPWGRIQKGPIHSKKKLNYKRSHLPQQFHSRASPSLQIQTIFTTPILLDNNFAAYHIVWRLQQFIYYHCLLLSWQARKTSHSLLQADIWPSFFVIQADTAL